MSQQVQLAYMQAQAERKRQLTNEMNTLKQDLHLISRGNGSNFTCSGSSSGQSHQDKENMCNVVVMDQEPVSVPIFSCSETGKRFENKPLHEEPADNKKTKNRILKPLSEDSDVDTCDR